MMFRNLALSLYASASELNRENIRRLVADARGRRRQRLVDLGCDDGQWTVSVARSLDHCQLFGVELVADQAVMACKAGLSVARANLNSPLPYKSDSFDIVHANQVIEHVTNVDVFVSEIHRVLRRGGRAVVSTENGSSWHNIFAAVMGWQIFSSTNVSGRVAGLGNPLAIQRGREAFSETWTHKTIFNYRGLIELFEVHGFREITVAGAGYFPLPGALGRLDVRHSVFLTVSALKP